MNSLANQLTFVVPVYNVEKYLSFCLDSLLSQTEKQFKVIIVDDGSTDSSSEIAKEYANKYPNLFNYVRQENKGLGGARNTGLALVDTKFTAFLDSDDFVAPKTVEKIYKKISECGEDTDIIFCIPTVYNMNNQSYLVWYDRDYLFEIFERANSDVINPSKTPQIMSTEASVWRSIWRTDFLKETVKLKFVEHLKWEDVPPHFVLMHKAQKAVMIKDATFYYRINSGNQITQGSGKGRLDLKGIMQEVLPYFEGHEFSKKEKAFMLDFLAKNTFWHIDVVDDEYLPQLIDIYHEFYKKICLGTYIRFFFSTGASMKNRMMIWFLRSSIHYKTLKSRQKIEERMRVFKRFKRIFKK